ncbi:AbrB family transcriptional regulator [Paenibacillus pectinilyticus]|uniref:AbrB family transcriptional regulator n=1 Tax=Paenibacillus pectinilyticus TaxID=512399 RepID=A0A1C0ZZE5_9BACL|nr:AbrB family transcriptional regulator [Paenibacillus pectinilyticus]OCT13480.1 AbrB family transcriptional regulator [Paenibacillus pectinilyticus]
MVRQPVPFNVLGKMLTALISALLGGYVFKLLHIPIPWLLGPMIAVLIGSNVTKERYVWPTSIRNIGLIIVGYTIGLSMTGKALHEMGVQLPYMLLMTLLLMLLCALLAYIVSKVSGINYKTALLGSIPGGLTQMVILAEETEGINLTIVTVTQVIRLMMIVISVPLLVFSPLLGNHKAVDSTIQPIVTASASWGQLMPNIFVFAAVCIVCALVGNKIKFPTAYLLGPAFGTAIVQVLGLHGPALPSSLINVAQIMIGINVGLMLKPSQLTNKLQTISLAIGSSLLLLIGAYGLSMIFIKLQSVSKSTALLSLAPGGMDQMGIIAHEINANLSIVAGYQLFRTFFIFFAVPPMLRLLFKYTGARKTVPKRQS